MSEGEVMSSRFHTFVQRMLLAIGLLMANAAPATDAPETVRAPDSIPGTTKVDAEGLIETIEKIPDLVIIDSRIAMDRKQGYIEGSVSLPDTDTDCDALSVLIKTQNTPTLFYCNGPKCGRSVKAIHKALSCGYTSLYWFRGGFEEWTAKGYPFLKE